MTTASSSVSSPPSLGIGGAGPHHHHFHPLPQQHQAQGALGGGAHSAVIGPVPPPPQRRRQNSASTSNNPAPSSQNTAATSPSHLPTESQQAQIAQARTALVASIGNALDTELQTRASLLHANQAAIEKQERDVERALRDLRKEDDKLMKVLNEGSRKVKELGDVQNWAERLERDFLVLEETMRLVDRGQGRRGSGSGSESGSWSGSESGSGSWSGSERASIIEDVDEEGDVHMRDEGEQNGEHVVEGTLDTDKGKQVATPPDAMDIDPAEVPLPTDETLMTATRDNTNTQANEQSRQATAQPSPGAMTWLTRFIWRTPG